MLAAARSDPSLPNVFPKTIYAAVTFAHLAHHLAIGAARNTISRFSAVLFFDSMCHSAPHEFHVD